MFDFRERVRKENQARAAIAEREHDGHGAYPAVFVVGLELFPSQPFLQEDRVVMVRHHAERVGRAIGGKVPARAVPDADEQKHDDDGQRDGVVGQLDAEFADEEFGERREHHVAHPGGQRDVPAVPEILHVARGEGIFKILRHRNADERRRADGHVAEAGKFEIKIQIKKLLK